MIEPNTYTLSFDEARRRREAARKLVSDIAGDRVRKWTLHIPAREDDPDVVLDDALLALDEMMRRAEESARRIAELEAQLAAVQTYANYHHDARAVWFAVGRPDVLTFDGWWQTPHCPECGRLELDRAPAGDRWECAGVDGCGYSWEVEPPTRP